mgnify:CR=1 FL=1
MYQLLHTLAFQYFHICQYLSMIQCLSWDHYPYSYTSIWVKSHICQILARTLCNTWYHYMSHIWAINIHNTLLCNYTIQLQFITYKHLSVVTHCLYLELYPHIGAKNHHKPLHFHHRSQWSTFNDHGIFMSFVIHIYSNYTFINHDHIILSHIFSINI